MKIDVQAWKTGLAAVEAVAKKTVLCEHGELVRLTPVSGGVELMCTNGTVEARARLPIDGELARAIHVPASPILSFINGAPSAHVDIDVQEESARFICHGSSMDLSIMDVELPEMPDDPAESTEVPGELLSDVIRSVRYVASNDPADAALHGVEIAVGHRIIRTRAGSREGRVAESIAGDGDPSSLRIALVSPPDADQLASAAKKAGDKTVFVSVGSRSIQVQAGALQIRARTSEQRMHDIGMMLDATVGECGAVVSTENLGAALDRVSAIASPSDAISIKVAGGQMRFAVESVTGSILGKASAQCPVESGQDWSTEILVAHRLLTSTTRSARSARVSIDFDADITLGHLVRVEPTGGDIMTRVGLARMRRRR